MGSRLHASRVGRALWRTTGTRALAESEEEERKRYANQVGADGWTLLSALDVPSTADWLKTLPAVSTLRTIWDQQFEPREQGGDFRLEPALPAGQLINSPYDLDARKGREKDHHVGG